MQTTKFAFNSTDLPLRQYEVGLSCLFSTSRPQRGPLFAKRAGLEFHQTKAPLLEALRIQMEGDFL